MKKIFLLLLITPTFLACRKSIADGKLKNEFRTYEYFAAHINKSMDDKELIKIFGEPDEDRGSGLHIFIYTLKDGTIIQISITDYIHSARHIDQNGQLLHVLI